MDDVADPGRSTVTIAAGGTTPHDASIPHDPSTLKSRPAGRPPAPLHFRDRSRYESLVEHARGGLGRVLRALDGELGRTVALKELLTRTRSSELRFFREALITARLEHPNIVPVHEAGRWHDGTPFYTMKLVAGRTLKEVIDASPLLEERLAHLGHVAAIADAMAYAHARGVIHRDLKPSNVMVGDFGETVVIDWGLAKDIEGADGAEPVDESAARHVDLTAAGGVLGTPAFMAPEQARGHADARADIFAMGALLYNLATAELPSGDGEKVMRKVRVPSDLQAIVRRAMAEQPAERYESMSALAQDLRAYIARRPVAAKSYSWFERLAMLVGRNQLAASLVIALLVVTLVASLVATASIRRQEARAIAAEEVARREGQLARASALESERRFVELMIEQGRAAVLGHEAMRGLVWLSAASERGAGMERMRDIVATGMRQLSARVGYLDSAHTDAMEVVVAADGEHVLGAGSGRGKTDTIATIWNVVSDTERLVPARGHFVVALAAHPTGTLAALGEQNGQVHLIDWARGSVVASYRHASAIAELKIDRKGRVLGIDRSGEVVVHDHGRQHRWRVGRRADAHWIEDQVVTIDMNGAMKTWSMQGRLLHTHTGVLPTLRAWTDGASRRVALVGFQEPIVEIRDARSGALVRSLRVDEVAANAAVLSPDGTLLATGGESGSVRLWSVPDGELLGSFSGHQGAVSRLVFASHGRTFATAGRDGDVKLWSASSPRLLAVFDHHLGEVRGLAFSPSGEHLVSSGIDGTVARWRAAPQSLLVEHLSSRGATDVAWSAAGPLVTSGGDDAHAVVLGPRLDATAALVHEAVAPATPMALFNVGDRRGVDITADGRIVVSAAKRGALVWDVRRASVIGECRGLTSDATSVALSPDASSVAVSGYDGDLVVCDVGTGTQRVIAEPWLSNPSLPSRAIRAVAFSGDGKRIAAAGHWNGVRVWRTSDGVLLATARGHAHAVTDVVFSPVDDTFATSGLDATIRVWSADGTPLSVFDAGVEVNALDWRRDGSAIAAGTDGGDVLLWDPHTRKTVAVYDEPLPVTGVAFSVDGETLASVTLHSIRLWDCSRGEAEAERLRRVASCLPFEMVDDDLRRSSRPRCAGQ